jgi:hypothetical protein
MRWHVTVCNCSYTHYCADWTNDELYGWWFTLGLYLAETRYGAIVKCAWSFTPASSICLHDEVLRNRVKFVFMLFLLIVIARLKIWEHYCVLVCFVCLVQLALIYCTIFMNSGDISCRGVTHKNSVITYCMRKLKKAESDPELFDRESIILLWKLLILLLRQNGVSSSLERNIAMCVASSN